MHIAIPTEDECFTIYHVGCQSKSKDQIYLDYTSLHTQGLSTLFAYIKYEETYGVTTTLKYNNDCDNASGTEFAFCYSREKRIQNFQ